MTGVVNLLMVLLGFCVLLGPSLAARNRGSYSFRYFPRPECPERAVCAEISTLSKKPWSSDVSETPLFTSYICKCPEDQECPTRPGTHTLHVSQGRWYSICKPICSLEKCERNEIAEEVLSGAKDFDGRTYRKINCLCPGYENSDMVQDEDATRFRKSKTDDERAKVVYQRVCSEYHTSWKRSDEELDIDAIERMEMEMERERVL